MFFFLSRYFLRFDRLSLGRDRITLFSCSSRTFLDVRSSGYEFLFSPEDLIMNSTHNAAWAKNNTKLIENDINSFLSH